MQKTILVVVGVVVIAAGAWYFISSGMPFDREPVDGGDVIAVVNGKKLSRADFEEFKSQVAAQQGFDIASLDAETKSQFETQVIDELIARTLLQQAAYELGVTASPEEIVAQIEAITAQLGGEEVFQQALEEEGLSEEELRVQISADIVTQTYLERELNLSSVTAADEEVEAMYAQEAAQNENIPALEEVQDQVERMVIQQKQQNLVTQLIQQLRERGDIKILI